MGEPRWGPRRIITALATVRVLSPVVVLDNAQIAFANAVGRGRLVSSFPLAKRSIRMSHENTPEVYQGAP
jgi:hypothetical protein